MRKFSYPLLIALVFAGTMGRSLGQVLRVSGVVFSAVDQKPVANANVQILNYSQGTHTDSLGRYSLRIPHTGTWQVQFSSVSFSTEVKNVPVSEETVQLNCAMQPALIQLNDQVVVTAQRYETRTFDRPEAITVLTSLNINRNGLRSTPELLTGQPGVFVQKTNHGGGSPFVRGLTGQQTLLLVDGIRLNNATFRSGPNQYLNTLDPFLLERVEVIRGGGAVQYGSDALGGTINLLTASPRLSEHPRFTGSAQARFMTGGMEKGGRLALGYSGSVAAVQGGFSYRSFGDLVGGQGIGRQTPTGYDQYSLDLKLVVALRPSLRLNVALQHLRQDSVPVYHKVQLENFAINQFNPQVRTLVYARLEGYTGTRWLRSWQITPLAGRTLEERQSRKNTAVRILTEKDQVATHGLLVSFRSEPTSFWTVQTGAEWYFDQVRSHKQEVGPVWSSAGPGPVERGLYPDRATMSNLAFYSLHNFRFDKWLLTAGGRFNTFAISIPDSDLGTSTISPSALVGNAGVTYSVFPFLNLVATVNSSFRAPNIDDLGTLGIVDFRYEVPNTSLRPERGLSKELGMKLKIRNLSSSVFVYHNQLSDLIGRVKTDELRHGYSVYLKENISKAFVRGLEVETEWQFAQKWMLAGCLNHTYGQNLSGNEPYRRIPPLNGKVGLHYQPTARAWARLDFYSAATQTRLAKGDIDDNRIPKGGTPGWNVFNLAAGNRLGRLNLSAEFQNIFNEAYRMHGSGVAEVGRSAWIRAHYVW